MKTKLTALLAAVLLSTAAPAYAGINWDTPRHALRHLLVAHPQTAQRSDHCREVLTHKDKWGQKEIEFCRTLG